MASILALIVVFVFNPFNLRTKLIGNLINSYLSDAIENYEPLKENVENENISGSGALPKDKHPFLSEEQEITLEKYGIDVASLPTSISPEMGACFVEKLGEERIREVVAGDAPSAVEIFKARSCLGE